MEKKGKINLLKNSNLNFINFSKLTDVGQTKASDWDHTQKLRNPKNRDLI